MQNLVIEATESTPLIDFQWETGILEIRGESYPENSLEFYRPVIDWLTKYLEEPDAALTLNVTLSYLNTSSIKCLVDILDKLEEVHLQGREIIVNWYYDEDNDRALDVAEEFKEDITLPFYTLPLEETE